MKLYFYFFGLWQPKIFFYIKPQSLLYIIDSIWKQKKKMDSLILSLLLFIPFVFFLLRLQLKKSTVRTPPTPTSLPIIGHLHHLLLTEAPPYQSLAHLAQKLGPIIHLQLGRVPTLVISSADLAKLVLKTHDHVFASRPQLVAAQWLSFGCSDVTFSPYGPYWRQARKICVTELLSSKRVTSFHLVRDEEVNRLLSHVGSLSGSEVDMSKLLFALANNVLCRVALGKRFIAEEEESKSKSEDRLVELLSETQALLAGWCVGDFFPEWEWVNWVSGFRRRLKRNLEGLRLVCDEIIQEHLNKTTSCEGGSGGNCREDFVDVLLRVRQRDNLEVPITDDNLKALVLVNICPLSILWSNDTVLCCISLCPCVNELLYVCQAWHARVQHASRKLATRNSQHEVSCHY